MTSILSKPTVSIVVPNYNYGHFADSFFQSIKAQTLPSENIEIIFVDDGSNDDSIEQATKWSHRIDCARFTVETPARSGKPGPVRNHGLSMAQGEYLICLDPDDFIHPEFLATCVETLQNEAAIDLVYTDYREIHHDKTRDVALPRYSPAQLRTQNPLPSAALYRRTLWDKGIRYRNNTAYEDWDYWVQCSATGAKFKHLDKTLYYYRIHAASYSLYALSHDSASKTQIVLNNPDFFHPLVREWAEHNSRGRLYSQPFRRGYIPGPTDVRELLKMISNKTLGQNE